MRNCHWLVSLGPWTLMHYPVMGDVRAGDELAVADREGGTLNLPSILRRAEPGEKVYGVAVEPSSATAARYFRGQPVVLQVIPPEATGT